MLSVTSCVREQWMLSYVGECDTLQLKLDIYQY